MSIVNYSFKRPKFQSNRDSQAKYEGFMLMEMVVGIFIFLATLFVGYSYLGMSSRWCKVIQMHNQAIDELSSLFEQKQIAQMEGFTTQSYYYTPHFVQTYVSWNASMPSVINVVSKRTWSNDEQEEHAVIFQTAY